MKPSFILIILCLVFSLTGFDACSEGSHFKVDSLNKLGRASLKKNPDVSLKLAREAMSLAAEESYFAGLAEGNYIIGQIFYRQGMFNNALNYHLQAQINYKKSGLKDKQAENLNWLGLIHYYLKQSDLALKNHEEALFIFEASDNLLGKAKCLGYIGHIYEKKQDYNMALKFQQQALEICQQLQNKLEAAEILENIGSIHEDKENFDQAGIYFQQALLYNQEAGNEHSLISNYNNMGDSFRKTGNYPKALEYTRKALNLSVNLNDKNQQCSALRDIGKVYALLGDYEKAYSFQEKSKILHEELYNREMARQVVLLNTLYEFEKKNTEIEVLENKSRLQHFQKTTTIIGSVLIMVVAGLVISRQKLKIKRKNDLLLKNQEIYEKENALIKAELSNKNLVEQRLQLELETQSKALTSHTLHNIQKNQILEELKNKLSAVMTSSGADQKKQLKNLVSLIDYSFNCDKDWADFRTIFEQVHKSFFDNLQENCPDLTANELRLSALIKLNLTSKDMATLMGISMDSLRIARYRLKKKFGLDKSENLGNFIQNLA